MTSVSETVISVKSEGRVRLLSITDLAIYTNEILRRNNRPLMAHQDLKQLWQEVLGELLAR